MSIQFTADDGVLHHFTVNRSPRNMIPGTAVEIAYQAGAADATVKDVSVVNSGRHMGITLVSLGVVLLIIGGGMIGLGWWRTRASRPAPSQAVPVTA